MEGELRRFSHPTRETTVEGRLDRPESPLLTGDDEGKKEDRVSSSCSLELKARLFFFYGDVHFCGAKRALSPARRDAGPRAGCGRGASCWRGCPGPGFVKVGKTNSF